MIVSGNLFDGIPPPRADEQVTPLWTSPHLRIERIVSHGQASAPGFWYDQGESEWVVMLAGAAAILIEGETQSRTLRRGDYLHIPPHTRHRVEWTAAQEPTIWLAVHGG